MSVDKKVFCGLLLWSVAVLLLMSSDSPIHGYWDRLDSAIFYTSGKALMSGMKPYVDFADSKGLLLWVIYGVGYLLSPHTYHGVWILSCLCYCGILYYNYKTAQLVLGDVRRSVVVAMVMPFFYFQYWFHDDVRAEDFCALFVAISLYYQLRVLYNCRSATARRTDAAAAAKRTVRRTGFILGGCFMALVMIKFSIAIMQGAMLLTVAYYYLRYARRQLVPMLLWMAAGMATVALPFVIYMLMTGTFKAFITEYFVKTMMTVQTEDGVSATYLEEVSGALGTPKRLALLMALLVCGWFASRRLPYVRYAPLFASLVFFAICTRHTLFHYYNICCVFLIFLPIQFLSHAESPLRLRTMAVIAACLLGWGISENVREVSHLHKVCIWTMQTREHSHNYFTSVIDGEKPAILYLYGCDYGYGMESEALPAGKYWTYQLGTTPEMEKEHVRPLLEKRADYIIANDYERCERKGYDDERICSYGYELLCKRPYNNFRGELRENHIYVRNDLE